MKRNVLLIITLILGTLQVTLCQDLIYRAKNPAFGGDTFNYEWLLSSAQEQNDYKEKSEISSLLDQDPVKQFQDDLNRQILNQLSRKLVTDLFGEEGLQDGTFSLGTFEIEISNALDGVHINILNINNGGETSIIIPYF
jgi:curli production assembly/transport component CsgF